MSDDYRIGTDPRDLQETVDGLRIKELESQLVATLAEKEVNHEREIELSALLESVTRKNQELKAEITKLRDAVREMELKFDNATS